MTERDQPVPFGAVVTPDGRVRFGLWAPGAGSVELLIERPGGRTSCVELADDGEGWRTYSCPDAGPGTRYRYRIDGNLLVPDPASRYQPDGIEGPSEVVDPSSFTWQVRDWTGRPWAETVLYELHVGTFTDRGDFDGVREKLEYLANLGITALEIMPVSTFAGRRGWGYDGVLPYAPHPAYGAPDAFRRFVDAAHALGIQVLLDVVYNHFGPEGNYLHAYASEFFSDRHRTPWGAAINFDGPSSRPVRNFFIYNALYWLEEFKLDGLRLDAVHAIADDSEIHILDELAEVVRSGPGRTREIHLVLENHSNEAHFLRGSEHRAPSYDAQWNDDFHHACHTLVTGEGDGYYVDYSDRPIGHLLRCLTQGFAYQGEISAHSGVTRGETSADLPSTAFIAFLQNHDQVGNRALGERLSSLSRVAPLRALTSLLLLAPAVPALFMGEEFGCSRPFLYFADFAGDLAEAVRDGRRREFASFDRFRGGSIDEIPDPMDETTFARSKLDWSALGEAAHRRWIELHRTLLSVRREALAGRLPARSASEGRMLGAQGLAVTWILGDDSRLSLLANLGDEPLDLEPGIPPRGKLLFADAQALEAGGTRPRLGPWTVRWYLAESES